MNRLILWFLISTTALLSFSPGHTQAQIPSAERQALIRFYHATGGNNWDDNTLWLSQPGNECEWHGVQCAMRHTENPFVLRLLLSDNNLTGQVPRSLAELDDLATLALGGNDLSGTIPPDLWGLSSLEGISLRNNRFSGDVPATILGLPEGMSGTTVDLSDNRLDRFGMNDFPGDSLGSEILLLLNGNRLTQIPPAAWRETGSMEILDLADNHIEGEVALDGVPWPGLKELNLSGNAVTGIAGLSESFIPELEILDLNGNWLEELPETLTSLENLTTLDASNNRLAGELPEWFAQLSLGRLSLDNNDLSGPVARAFATMDQENFPRFTISGREGLHLHVANNRFSGPLPELDFEQFNAPTLGPSSDFGLDLCFNDIDPPGSETLEIIEGHHRGRGLSACLGRDQSAMDATASGSWFHPERSGEGITQMLLENGQNLVYWFTFTPPDDDEAPRQQWLFGVARPSSSWTELRPLWTATGGRFGQGLAGAPGKPSSTWMRHNRIDSDTMHFTYQHRGLGVCITGSCSRQILAERFDHVRLTQLAGTTCDNRSPQTQEFSGAWYNPERAGEGFIVEVLSDGKAVVYWFTYKPDGSGEQAWMTGVGEARWVMPLPPSITNVSLTFDEVYQPVGGQFGPAFDPADLEMVDWGELSMHFRAPNSGEIQWDSHLEEYGAGSYAIERLARPMLADCD